MTCQECGHRSRNTCLANLQSGQAPNCFCNRGCCWSSPEGHARCLSMLMDRYGAQCNASRMNWVWWQASVKYQKFTLDVTCRECGHRSRSTCLASLQPGQAPGCFCSKKTEAKLQRWLAQTFPDAAVMSQVQCCTNTKTQRFLPFDFGLYNGTVLIELDGRIGHFGFGWNGSQVDKGAQRDLIKERWAILHNRSVIRLLQEDVYGDCWNWQAFLTCAIQHAIQNSKPCVVTQDAEEVQQRHLPQATSSHALPGRPFQK